MSRELKKMKPRVALDSTEQRLRAIAVVMVLCLLLVIGIVVVVGPGKSRKGGITAQTSQPTTSAAQGTQSSDSLESVIVPPLSVYRRRNIFQPLINEEPISSTPAATTTTGTAGGTAVGPARVVTLPPELDATGGQAGSVISTALTLEGVSEQDGKTYARIRVGDNLFEKVAVGDVFAQYYKLLALGKDSSASILYGDERFSMFVGQSLYW